MEMGQSVTHAALQSTHSPSWEELLLIEVKEEESKDEGLSSKWCKCHKIVFSITMFQFKLRSTGFYGSTSLGPFFECKH